MIEGGRHKPDPSNRITLLKHVKFCRVIDIRIEDALVGTKLVIAIPQPIVIVEKRFSLAASSFQ